MKGKTLVLSLAAIALVIANSVASLAYFTDSDSITNTFTVGSVKIRAISTYSGYDADGNEDAEACNVLTSGKKCVRTVSIKNTSTVPVYVKADVAIPEATGDMFIKFNRKASLNFSLTNEGFSSKYADFEWYGSTVGQYINTYTYLQKLLPGETTSMPIAYTIVNNSSPITEIDIDKQLDEGSSLDATNLSIRMIVYAIQADGFASAAEAFANYQ